MVAFTQELVLQARIIADGNITQELKLLLRINRGSLKRIKLLLAHDSLSHVYSVHVAAVTDAAETKIEVIAV